MPLIELRDEPLAYRTTLGVGGTARLLAEIDREALLVEWIERLDEPFYVLGGGSNVVIGDGGIDQPVLVPRLGGIEQLDPRSGFDGVDADHEVLLTVGAGVVWDDLVGETVSRGLSGLECLSGIPGLSGATPIQNVGAYGQQISDRVVDVRAYDLHAGAVVVLPAKACRFGYRDSLFKHEGRQRYVVLGLRLRLSRRPPEAPRYAQLARALAEAGADAADPRQIRDVVLALRQRKSMVLDDADPNSRSAGSFFLNPVLTTEQANAVEGRARAAGQLEGDGQMPRFEAGPGQVKLAAAWLIERAGFPRGHVEGAVGLSSHHALAIINRGGATAADVVGLARRIRDGVARCFGVALTPEPDLLGDFGERTEGLARLRPPLLQPGEHPSPPA